ncbi:MAG TPA: short-chain dehydrogenase [Chitinophagaceae bacterium]|jgi:hypothetical protein|nr:short-chain dehydrogenase [Chitinophagaceae bacterium]
MTSEQIEKFLQPEFLDKTCIQISFKTRQGIKGIFIKLKDFSDLKSKNLWRIVSESKLEEYSRSKDANLARIFNGTEMTRLVLG